MLIGLPFGDGWQSGMVSEISGLARWNQYVCNWPVVLDALRRLWETGKLSELKSPYYAPLEASK